MEICNNGNEANGQKLGKKEARIQIDWLELCFKVKSTDLKYLQSDACSKSVGKYDLRKSKDIDMYYDWCFDIFETYDFEKTEKEYYPLGKLLFGTNVDRNADIVYVHLRIANRVLYQPNLLQELVNMPFLIGKSVLFNNITRIDIAADTKSRITTTIKRLLRDENISTIYNGTKVKDRNLLLQEHQFIYSSSLNRLLYPTIQFAQKKTKKRIDDSGEQVGKAGRGISVQAYNKKAEIKYKSPYKHYILEHYGNPQSLYRLEVRLYNDIIKEYLKSQNMEYNIDLIFDKTFLCGLFLKSLKSVIRFTNNKRKSVPWEEILNLVL